MAKIVGISGSLRQGSFNTMLLNQAARMVRAGTTFEIGSIRDIPLCDGDVETAAGLPPAAPLLKTQVLNCDGLLRVTPEYNNSIPGIFKNAIDWLTRPPAVPRVFGKRPVADIGASPGGFGTILSQEAGEIKDDAIRAQLKKFTHGFAQFVADNRAPGACESAA